MKKNSKWINSQLLKRFAVFTLSLLFFYSCNQSSTTGSVDKQNKLKDAAENSTNDKEIKKLKEIRFEITVIKDKDIFDDGIRPWVELENPEPDISRMKAPDQIVIDRNEVILIIDYPLTNAAKISLKSESKEGFTRVELVRKISEIYHQIYDEEEKTSTIKTIPRRERKGMLNRNRTDGIYGIWGHDLGDLALNLIEVIEMEDTFYLYLEIYS